MGKNIAVLGAGVTGLTAAVRLQEAGHRVAIVARDFPGPFETVDAQSQINYTSPWGGAHNRWHVPPAGDAVEQRDHALSVRTQRALEQIAAAHPEAGVTFLPGIEYFEAPAPEYSALTPEKARELGIDEFRMLGRDEFPDEKIKLGYRYRTWALNPMVYCCFLLRRFTFGGGRVVKREVREPVELFSMEDLGRVDVVVNASGNGFGDENVFITRGQTCLVANACDATVTRQNADGNWIFSVPRFFDGGTIIGGTKEPDNWDPNPSPAVRDRLLKGFAATYPSVLGTSGKYTVIRDIVGRRPTRKGGMRLEREDVGKGRSVVHAYGAGGRGYEVSWGVADVVLDMVEEKSSGLLLKSRL